MRLIKGFAVIAGILLIQGCRSVGLVPVAHLLMVDGQGRHIDPTGNDNCLREGDVSPKYPNAAWHPCDGDLNRFENWRHFTRGESDAYLTALFDSMKNYYQGKQDGVGKPQTRRIVVFFHGGLNEPLGSIRRVQKLHQVILDDGYYPIFINWQSSIGPALRERYLYEGRPRRRAADAVPPLLSIPADIGRAAGRAPLLWYMQIRRAVDSIDADNRDELRDAERAEKQLMEESAKSSDTAKFMIWHGDAVRSPGERFVTGLGRLVSLPFELVLTPVFDLFGAGQWESLQRHVRMPVYTPAGTIPREGQPEAVVSIFFARLQDEIARTACQPKSDHPDCANWDITLIGHSMGTTLVNYVLAEFGKIEFRSIVYMAAACSVDEYDRASRPYLRDHPASTVYHLVLHPSAEIDDGYLWGLAPRGSLLTWIDGFLNDPHNVAESTAGQYINLLRHLGKKQGDPVLKQTRVRIFDYGRAVRGSEPQSHGDFTSFPFWRPEFWAPQQ
jgi:hypothetical protein